MLESWAFPEWQFKYNFKQNHRELLILVGISRDYLVLAPWPVLARRSASGEPCPVWFLTSPRIETPQHP